MESTAKIVKAKKKLPLAALKQRKVKRARRRKSRSAASALIDLILNYHGGPRAAAKMLTEELETPIGEQVVTNWRIRGKVPLRLAPRVAKVFEVPVYALNYGESCSLYGKVEPWKGIVSACKILSPESRRRVLALTAPSAE